MINRLPSLTCAHGTGIIFEAIFGKPIFGLNTDKRVQQLKQDGVKNITQFMGNKNVVLKTWEGLHFFLFSVGM